MPAKRTPIARALRTPRFSDEVLALFAHLETFRDQDSREFQDGSQHLAGLLHLADAFLCSGAYVNDKSATHCYPDDFYPAAEDFFRVRAVREQLLAAINGQSQTERDRDRKPSTGARTSAPDIPVAIAAAAGRHDEYE